MNEKNVTIAGVVGAVEWDNMGQVSMVSISTSTDTEYLVLDNKLGRELLNYEGEDVIVTGAISESEFGETGISVSSYEVLADEFREENGRDDYRDEEKDVGDDGDEEDFDDYDYEDYTKGYKF